MATATAGGAAAPKAPPAPKKSVTGTKRWAAGLFLLPALILLGALVVYPIGYTVARSFFGVNEFHSFVGFDNYGDVFTEDRTQTALKNNLIWVIVAPTVATALGLIFAVLTERVRWGTAFKVLVFMPMAISMLAAGIIFRLVYDQDPDKGVANAVMVGIHDTFAEASAYPGARPRPNGDMTAVKGTFTTKDTFQAGSPAALPLVGIPATKLPDAADAKAPPTGGDGLSGTVWLDFKPGGGGKLGAVDPGEKALSGVKVEAVSGGKVVGSAKTAEDGTFTIAAKDVSGPVQLRLPASNFREQYGGVDWLGPNLVTPAIIGSYVWMWAGFAMVLIAAGLASVPRELLEAARVDGANEWKVFSRVTVPLLAPVLIVVMVTLMINVLKIFDLVYIIAPGSTQQEANVLALQLYLDSFGGGNNQGVGSAIAVILLLLVIPVMWFNIRRIRREGRR